MNSQTPLLAEFLAALVALMQPFRLRSAVEIDFRALDSAASSRRRMSVTIDGEAADDDDIVSESIRRGGGGGARVGSVPLIWHKASTNCSLKTCSAR